MTNSALRLRTVPVLLAACLLLAALPALAAPAPQAGAALEPATRAGEEEGDGKDKEDSKEDLNFRAIIGIITPVLIVLGVCVVFVCCLRTGDKAVQHMEARAESRRNSVDLQKGHGRTSVDSGLSVPIKPGGRASMESGMSLPPATTSTFSIA